MDGERSSWGGERARSAKGATAATTRTSRGEKNRRSREKKPRLRPSGRFAVFFRHCPTSGARPVARPTNRRRVAPTVTRSVPKRRDRALRRGRPRVRATFETARVAVFASFASSRGIRARAPRAPRGFASARAPRAREKKRAKSRSWRREETEGTRGWRARAYLAQGAEPLGVDRGLVHENLLRAVVGGDETEPLLGVEPLHLRASPAGGESQRTRDRSHLRESVASLLKSAARTAARRQGSAREASEEAVRFDPCRQQHTLPVSFVIVFRGGNCD